MSDDLTTRERRTEYMRHWRERNREQQHNYDAARYAKDRDANIERALRWRSENMERARETAHDWWLRNKDDCLARNREWYRTNPDARHRRYERDKAKVLERARQWAAANRDRKTAAAQKRRAREQGAAQAQGSLTEFYTWSRKTAIIYCWWCWRPTLEGERHVDHAEPLCREGAHVLSNLYVTCESCNLKKSRKPLLKWLSIVDPRSTANG